MLTANGRLQQRLTDPRFGHWRTYWVQVEGTPVPSQLDALCRGVVIQKQRTRPARVDHLPTECWQALPEREPPIRKRKSIPTSWLTISLTEGRNRQVRRMTAAIGLPTLRLIRYSMDLMDGGPPLSLNDLRPGEWRAVTPDEQDRLTALLKRTPRHRSRSRP